jgi:enoyl-CoA hydratase/carnithine racemase
MLMLRARLRTTVALARSLSSMAKLSVSESEGLRMFQLNGSASLNSLDLRTAHEMQQMLRCLQASTSVTSYALHGKNGYFCGGVDLDWLSANRGRAPELYKALGDLYEFVASSAKPIVAIVNGDVSGGGLGLTNSMFRIVTSGARFSIPEPSFGLVPDGPVLKMLAKCDADSGLPVASYLALTGQPIGSNDMMLLGLATHQIHDNIITNNVIRSLASVSYVEVFIHLCLLGGWGVNCADC